MKNLILITLLALSVSSCSLIKNKDDKKSETKSAQKSNDVLKTPKFEKMILPNGIQVYLLLDNSLPYFNIQGILAAGSANDFKDRSGVASMTATMLKEGSGNLDSKSYKSAYSKYSSEFSVNVDKDLIHFKSDGLSSYAPEISKLFLDTIFKPYLAQPARASESIKEFDKIKEKRLAQLKKFTDEPSYYATVSFNSFLFGKEGYGLPELGTEVGVKKILLSDVQKFYKENWKPENLQFSLTGNYSDKTKDLVLTYLKEIKASPSNIKNNNVLAKAPSALKPRLIIIDKPNMKQAEVRIGHYGPIRSDKDFIPLYIANTTIGSGDFNSKLMEEMRVKRGLVYGISSHFNGFKNAGALVITSSTRHEKVPELIQATLEILKNTKTNGVDPKELNIQKSILLGQFPLKFETNDLYLNQLMRYGVYGFGENYIQDFYEKIKNIQVEDANLVLKSNYKPEELLIVVLASKKEIPANIKDLKLNIEYIDYKNVF